jgi:hypothetical protein
MKKSQLCRANEIYKGGIFGNILNCVEIGEEFSGMPVQTDKAIIDLNWKAIMIERDKEGIGLLNFRLWVGFTTRKDFFQGKYPEFVIESKH